MNRLLEPLERRTHLDAGELDTLFGNGEMVSIAFPGGTSEVVDFATRSDGTIYVAATVTPAGGAGRRLGLARFRSDGSPDTSFGADGWATVRIGSVDTIAAGIAVQPDGRIVVVGTSVNPPQNPPHFATTTDAVEFPIADERNVVVARFRTNGSLDRTFGRRGVATVDVGKVASFSAPIQVKSFASDEGRAVLVQPDGKLLIAGQGVQAESIDAKRIVETPAFALARLNTDGSPDESFGADGPGISIIGGDNVVAMGLDPQGRALVIGSSRFTTFSGADQTSRSVRRFNPDGSIDDSYQTFSQNNQGVFFDGAVQPDGAVLALGSRELLRFNPDGSRDSTFDESAADSTTFLGNIAPDHGGRIVFIGSREHTTQSDTRVTVLKRVLANGAPDTAFGSGALVENTTTQANFSTRGIVVNSDGSYLVLGRHITNHPVLARFFRDDGPAALLKVKGINAPRSQSLVLTLTYRDDDGIDLASLDNRDVRVTGPNGFVRYAKLSLVGDNSDPRKLIVRYKLVAPGGSWNASDNGVYTIRLRGNQVADIDGNFAATPTLGSFRVNIPPQTGFLPASLNRGIAQAAEQTRLIDLVNGES